MASERTYKDGQPYYCALCSCGWDEYLACEMPDCQLESVETAQQRRYPNGPLHIGQIVEIGTRKLRVCHLGDPADMWFRVAVRNVATNRLSYIPEWRLLKAVEKAHV